MFALTLSEKCVFIVSLLAKISSSERKPQKLVKENKQNNEKHYMCLTYRNCSLDSIFSYRTLGIFGNWAFKRKMLFSESVFSEFCLCSMRQNSP